MQTLFSWVKGCFQNAVQLRSRQQPWSIDPIVPINHRMSWKKKRSSNLVQIATQWNRFWYQPTLWQRAYSFDHCLLLFSGPCSVQPVKPKWHTTSTFYTDTQVQTGYLLSQRSKPNLLHTHPPTETKHLLTDKVVRDEAVWTQVFQQPY